MNDSIKSEQSKRVWFAERKNYRLKGKKVFAAVLMGITLTACTNKQTTNEDMNTTLQLTQEWDKVFPQSDKVTHEKVTFKNRFGIELAADLRPLCADAGRARIPDHRLRPQLYGREWRRTSLCILS